MVAVKYMSGFFKEVLFIKVVSDNHRTEKDSSGHVLSYLSKTILEIKA